MRNLALPIVLTFAIIGACGDPIHDGAVKQMGNETSGVPVGQYHRAGQACVVCHQDSGPANQVFTVAGTVFAQPNTLVGVDQAEVRMTDSAGTKYIAKTNCVGNFFVTPDQWNPQFPILVRVAKGGTARTMQTPIGREGSCGFCHHKQIYQEDQFTVMPHVYLFGGDEPGGPSADCPVNPDLGGG
jgi:hypothetical protein